MKHLSETIEDLFQRLRDHLPDAVIVADKAGGIRYTNPAAHRLFGYSEKELEGVSFHSFFKHEEEWDDFLQFTESALSTLRFYEIELKKQDGTSLFADISLARIEAGGTWLTAAFIHDVTELRNLLLEKKGEERLLSDILNAIEDGISLLDRDLTIVRTNAWMEKMYQKHLPLRGKKCYTVYQQRTSPCPFCPSLPALKEGTPHSEIIPYPSQETPEGWAEVFACPIRDIEGNITGVVEYVRDITEQKKLRDQLAESEERYRKFFENSAVSAYIINEDGKIIAINNSALRLLGYSREELSRLNASDIYKDPKEREGFIKKIRQKGSVQDFPLHLKRKDGKVLVCLDTATLVSDKQSHPFVYQGIIRDVTEQEKRERELHRLYTLVRQTDTEIVITDINGTIEYINPAFEKITGYSADEVRGQNPRILKSGQHDEAFYKHLWNTITGGDAWHGRLINKRKDGTLYYEDAHIFPIFDEKGTIQNYAAIKRDITREVALEEQLQQAAKLEAIGQLVGGIAHDYNNVLTSIRGFAELGLSKISPRDPLWDDLSQIHSAAEQAARITRQLLSFSRRQVISPKPVSGNQIVREMRALLQRYIGEDIQLIMTLTPKRDVIIADLGQIEQCLLNLVINARDAILAKGKKTRKRVVTVETDVVAIGDKYLETHIGLEKGDYFVISVSDTGIGMDKETLRKIFDPFFTTKPEGKGTGLGCSTVFGIVKQNRGMVHGYSEPGVGTTIKIYWPLTAKEAVVKKEDGVAQTAESGQETILVVEDDPSIRRLVKQTLEMAGYRVFEAESGAQALKLVEGKELSVDLLFTDIVMTGMTGDELAKVLQEKMPALKVLFSSGYTENHIFQNGILKSGKNFLHKPYAIRDLLRKIREVLDSDEVKR